MCEWLSHREWCDVHLHCGGRTFKAHRTVLASVSHFLKRLLLSCPLEETPTFIVLPDFDFDAMSSVLYYIYNGEVVVERHKLHMFLDIVRAMQIFVDEQCLAKSDITTQNTEQSESVNNDEMKPVKYKDQHYVTIKKCKQTHDILHPISLRALDLRDKHATRASFWDWSTWYNASLGNPQLSYGDRQRSTYLRDLFIETYPWNGNANGGATSVPAIPKGHYHGTTSPYLANANCRHPTAAETAADTSEKTSGQHFSPKFLPNLNNNQFVRKSGLNNKDYGSMHWGTQINGTKAELIPHRTSQFPDLLFRVQSKIEAKSISVIGTVEGQNPYLLSTELNTLYNNADSESHSFNAPNNSCDVTRFGFTRSAILNKVLDSPWCTHPPNSYKPFRRKLNAVISTPLDKVNENCFANESDSNNNIQKTSQNELTVEAVCMESKEIRHASFSTECDAKDEFKCNICNQVFTSNEALRSHAKRHSTTARYTCSECSKSFSQLRNFKYHMSVHRGTREFAATCTVCGKYFNDRGYLSSHMKIHRNRKEYKCAQCPKSFNQRVAYNMHVRIHTGLKPHVCEECGKAFSRKMLLKQHRRTHSGERPYACAHCDKRFADRSNMTLHLRLHTGVKPFSCSMCPKSFTKKHHLKSHLNFHTGAKPYSCPRCKLAFTQSSNMRTHYKKCNAPDPAHMETST